MVLVIVHGIGDASNVDNGSWCWQWFIVLLMVHGVGDGSGCWQWFMVLAMVHCVGDGSLC